MAPRPVLWSHAGRAQDGLAVPRSVPLFGTRKDQARKNRDINGAMAFGGRGYFGKGGEARVERVGGRGPIVWDNVWKKQKNENKLRLGLRRLP